LDIDVGLFRPTISTNHLWDLIQMQLEQAVTPAAVRQIVLEVIVSTPLRQKQGELFGSDLRCPRELGGLLERLSSRLGRDAVLQVRLRREPLPEDTFAEQPAAGQAARNLGGQAAHGPLERPLFFYHPPRPLHVEVVGTGEPLRIQWRSIRSRQTWQQVAKCWGPERLETSWWRGPSVRRDYFRIETISGERFWIFRRLVDSHWFLHGAFG
jgi:protein ImuB